MSEEVGDELVIYVQARQTAQALSEDAAAVWRHCDGHSLAMDIASRLGLDETRVAQALDELSAAELMEEPEGISRRVLYKRIAKLGAATLSAPLIYSVAVAPPGASASPLACGVLLNRACNVFWTASDCSGPPRLDGCTSGSGSAACTCEDLGPCHATGSQFVRNGTCT